MSVQYMLISRHTFARERLWGDTWVKRQQAVNELITNKSI